jgi:uncharacterized OB-fold protein
MSQADSFCIESFYKFVGEGRLMGAKCNKCGTMHLPPKPVCTNCFSTDLKWVEVNSRGKLLTYTVIHVAPKQFESAAPYSIGILKLDDGPQLLGMIREVPQDQLKIGMHLKVNFEKPSTQSTEWPTWSRFYFKP